MALNPLIVIGGGVSGLSCAYYLQKLGKACLGQRKIIVLEGSDHLGGWLKSRRFDDGVVHELGPRGLRASGKFAVNTLNLADEVGLRRQVLGVSVTRPATQKRLILSGNKLHTLPTGLMSMFFRREPFSKALFTYVRQELKKPKLDIREDEDISVYDFVNRRFGEEVANFFVDPICRGITAGDARKLSMKGLFPEMFHLEQTTGSLTRGLMWPPPVRPQSGQSVKEPPPSDLAIWAKGQKWATWSLRGGIQTLAEAMCAHLLNLEGKPVEIFNQSQVEKIDFNSSTNQAKVTVAVEDGHTVLEADHVFSTVSASSLAKCLPKTKVFTKLRDGLNSIKSVNVAVVCLEFKGKDVLGPEAGFGFLVPSFEDVPVLGVVYDSCSYPQLDAEKDITRVTCMMGGEWFESLFGAVDNVSEDHLLSTAVSVVRKYIGFKADPIRHIVAVHKNCIPQYYLHHRRLVADIKQEIVGQNLNLDLLGSSYSGVSVNECIYYGKECAQNYISKISGDKAIS